jgi:glycosyltransferase involved in cell wall biosynthesis
VNKLDFKYKILICYDFYPPAFKGGGIIRSVFNLSEFLTEFCEVYVFTSDSDLGASSKLNVSPNTWVDYAPDLKVFYSNRTTQNLKRIYQLINSVKPDVIYLNGIFTPKFSLYPLLISKFLNFSPLWVMAPRGMLQKGALSIKPSKKKIYLFILRHLRVLSKIKWQATDSQEEIDIKRIFGSDCRIETASNIPNFHVSTNLKLQKKEKELNIVFLALISPVKNLKYLIDILNQIEDSYSIKLAIYGPIKDALYWEECQKSISNSLAHIKISYRGELESSKVNEVLREYHLFSMLSLGENFGHSIFESLIAGTPVLISNKTPWKELEKHQAGWDVNLNDPNTIQNLIQEIANLDQSAYENLRKGAKIHADRYIQENDFKKQYQKLFELT